MSPQELSVEQQKLQWIAAIAQNIEHLNTSLHTINSNLQNINVNLQHISSRIPR